MIAPTSGRLITMSRVILTLVRRHAAGEPIPWSLPGDAFAFQRTYVSRSPRRLEARGLVRYSPELDGTELIGGPETTWRSVAGCLNAER